MAVQEESSSSMDTADDAGVGGFDLPVATASSQAPPLWLECCSSKSNKRRRRIRNDEQQRGQQVGSLSNSNSLSNSTSGTEEELAVAASRTADAADAAEGRESSHKRNVSTGMLQDLSCDEATAYASSISSGSSSFCKRPNSISGDLAQVVKTNEPMHTPGGFLRSEKVSPAFWTPQETPVAALKATEKASERTALGAAAADSFADPSAAPFKQRQQQQRAAAAAELFGVPAAVGAEPTGRLQRRIEDLPQQQQLPPHRGRGWGLRGLEHRRITKLAGERESQSSKRAPQGVLMKSHKGTSGSLSSSNSSIPEGGSRLATGSSSSTAGGKVTTNNPHNANGSRTVQASPIHCVGLCGEALRPLGCREPWSSALQEGTEGGLEVISDACVPVYLVDGGVVGS
ncbi:hypothetical protein cyc_08873 [Cyclospora cayetanensis]|uniref:Uncharacterized protein n=1 Tax=Cyclospora cayetanensis TaxID=88456 RepID=A0A1D3D7J8_9EIME|nr:hypothetical protein cyc_08873 [Cyclospora cayetanensis]